MNPDTGVLKKRKKVSRQREWQRRQIAIGRCQICAQPAVTKSHCEHHRERQLDLNAQWRKAHPNYMKDYAKARKAERQAA